MSALSPIGKANWTASRDAFLVEQLIGQQNIGKRSDTGWTKEAWRSVLHVFNKKFGLQHHVQQLKSRLAQLKKQYRIVKSLLSQSGFSWDVILHTVIADDAVWEQYLSEHPDARPFRKISLPLYEELSVIFEGASALGKGQLSSIRPEPLEDGTSATGTSRTPFDIPKALPALEGNSEEFESGSEKEIPLEDSKCSKRQRTMTVTTRHDKRVRLNAGNGIIEPLQCTVTPELVSGPIQTAVENDNFSYVRCLEELQELEGLEESELVQAIEVLRDEKSAVAFMTLKGPLRLAWLRSKCSKQ